MLQILGITSPIFLLIGIGFLCARFALVSREQIAGMGKFVITLALPALVIRAMTERPLHELFERNYLLVYGAASLLVFVAGLLFAHSVRRDSFTGSVLSGLGMSMSNSGFIGYPLVSMALGPVSALGLAMNMVVENLLMLPLALALAEAGEQRGGWRRTLREVFVRLLRNPIIIAICLGLALALLDLRLPAVPGKVVEMLASASAPVALFVIGGNLYGLKVGRLFADVAQIGIGKLLLHPLAVLLCLQLFPVEDPQLRLAAVLFACAPMMSIYPIIGQRFGLEGRCAAALVASTVLSFLTISAFLALLH
ncbi:AEC family transporter [Zestomonas thermotolerans]|jgi:malonate transporter|uniref:AEC family transporter n=1 Tax=Zestomonas thermotolerans TaxID=157784 RepID=UPI0003701561|nr:AEC family transporter [Pseudomonas thermotolerans]MBO2510838.1 permease [Gammaproteobacteria bacterium]